MEMYDYIEHSGDTLKPPHPESTMPIMWAQEGQYGWITKNQVKNLIRRYDDLEKQQKGYSMDAPLNLKFYWSEVQILDPITVRLMRETSP